MSGKTYLCSTRQDQFRPLSHAGQAVQLNHRQVHDQLAAELGMEEASLFAEPVFDASQQTVGWYALLEGEARQVSQLPDQQRAAALEKMGKLAATISAYAEKLEQSERLHQQSIGRMLKQALNYPSDEFLFVVDGQPVVVCWGAAPPSAGAPPVNLMRFLDPPSAKKPPPADDPPPPAADPPGPPVKPPYQPGENGDGPKKKPVNMSWLIWLLAGALLAMLLALGLKGCGVVCGTGRPGGDLLEQARQREGDLNRQLESLQEQYRQRLENCPPRVEPPPPPPEPADAPEPEEVHRRVEERGGTQDKPHMSLSWNTLDDVDLWVKEPGQDKWIHWKYRGSPTGGYLEKDTNASAPLTKEPIEHIYWARGLSPGKYIIKVRLYNKRETPKENPIPFTLKWEMGSQKGSKSGTVSLEKEDSLFELEIPAESAPEVPTESNSEGADTITNSLGMKFVLIPAGSFMMGSPDNESKRDGDEKQHRVTITKPFYLQTTEVTQGQWKAVMGSNPSRFKSCGDDCPVENVSCNDVQEFIRKLNQREGGDKYRLPTEAEWEYACRAGSTTAISSGEMRILGTNNAPALDPIAWYGGNSCVSYSGGYDCSGWSERQKNCSRCGTNPVAHKKANAWGLYDMHGNVWEWCQDWYGDYPSGSVTDPQGPGQGTYRVVRGGSWNNVPRVLRSAQRGGSAPGGRAVGRSGDLGFRLSRIK